MNAELEALILAFDAAQEARDRQAGQPIKDFEALLNKTLEKHAGLSRVTLIRMVSVAHRKWARRQKTKPPHLPPRA
jgi:hypothetical protein